MAAIEAVPDSLRAGRLRWSEQLERARVRLREGAEHARAGDRERFLGHIDAELDQQLDPGAAERFRQAAPPEQLWLGLERYWRKRAETAPL